MEKDCKMEEYFEMDERFENFLQYIIKLIKENYNETLQGPEDESESEKLIRIGENTAYYDVLNLLRCTIEAFGYDTKPFGQILPELGKKADI